MLTALKWLDKDIYYFFWAIICLIKIYMVIYVEN